MLTPKPQFHDLIFKAQVLLELHFKQPLTAKKPLIIIGLSGGPDSVFLLHLLHQLAQQNLISLAAAHLDHGWRESSASDVIWCKGLCEKLGIRLYTQHAHNLPTQKNIGSQEALGRNLRRSFFKNLAQELNADLVALGHHADDQQETFFMRLIRGTSLNGLRCIDTFSGIYFRPLLHVKKSFIVEYLKSNSIEYLIDETNESDSYLRNRIRKQVLPALRDCDTRFGEKFASTLERLQEEDSFLQELAQKKFDEIFTEDTQTGKVLGNVRLLQILHPVLQKRVLIIWLIKCHAPFIPQHSFLLELLKFLTSPRGGSHQLHEIWFVKKEAKRFWLGTKTVTGDILKQKPFDFQMK